MSRHLVAVGFTVLLTLSACGGSSDDDSAADAGVLNDPTGDEESPAAIDETDGATGTDGTDEANGDEPAGDNDAGVEDTADGDAPAAGEDSGDGDAPTAGEDSGDGDVPIAGEDTGDGDAPTAGEDTGDVDGPVRGEDTADGSADSNEAQRPDFPADSTAARIFNSLTAVVGNTVVDLNRRLSSGIELTPQQNDCLGTFDPAFGESLLAVDCVRALATGGVRIYVAKGAFYSTNACRSSIAEERIDNCIVRLAAVSIRNDFNEPTTPARPQPLPGTGVEIEYRIEENVLRIMSDEDALRGRFSCTIGAGSGDVTTLDADCENRMAEVADRMELLQSQF